MSQPKPLLIEINDLPVAQVLTEEELLDIFGAGRARRRRSQHERPQMLEVRQMLSAISPQSLIQSEIIAFDVTTSGRVSFNLDTGIYSANLELPGGMVLDTSALKTLANGQFATPKVDPVQAVAKLGGAYHQC